MLQLNKSSSVYIIMKLEKKKLLHIQVCEWIVFIRRGLHK